MEISEQEFQSAVRRGGELRRHGYALSAEYDSRQNRLVVGLSSGVTIIVPVHLVEDLAGADPADLAEIEITPSALGCIGLAWTRMFTFLAS